MKNKMVLTLSFLCMLILAGLLFLAVCAQRKQYRDLTLVIPDGYAASSYNLHEIEKISDETVAVTYEIKKNAAAAALNSVHSVTLIGTNVSYHQVIGLEEVKGRFFTEADWKLGNHYAVLNETAAFRLFGSNDIIGNTVKLDGEIFLITGIVKDAKEDEAVVYVAASTISGKPRALMVKTKEGAGAVRNSLMQLAIFESNSKIIDLSAVSQSFWQQFITAVFAWGLLFTLGFAYRRLPKIKEHYTVMKLRYQTMYAKRLVKESRRELRGIACQGTLTVLSMAAFFLLSQRILRIILGWKDILEAFKYLSDYEFQEKLQWLIRYFYCGPVLFLLFFILLFMTAGILAFAKN